MRNIVNIINKSGIVVIGSINMDIVNHVLHHPLPGETIKGLGTEYCSGGKGANQAVASSLAGGKVTMIGAVGDDPFGAVLKESLSNNGIGVNHIYNKSGSSGLAFITVSHQGENHIILSEGANGLLSEVDVLEGLSVLKGAEVILLQNEIPWESTLQAINWAHINGTKVYYNPAPAMNIAHDIYPFIDIMILNEIEAQCLTDIAITNLTEAEKAADDLIREGIKAVIVTLGEKGSLYKDMNGKKLHSLAYNIEVQDTTAAGDTFIGAFAVAQLEGMDTKKSLRFASAAAALCVSKKGAQTSIPTKKEIEFFLEASCH